MELAPLITLGAEALAPLIVGTKDPLRRVTTAKQMPEKGFDRDLRRS
jgi:hypothetical protein